MASNNSGVQYKMLIRHITVVSFDRNTNVTFTDSWDHVAGGNISGVLSEVMDLLQRPAAGRCACDLMHVGSRPTN